MGRQMTTKEEHDAFERAMKQLDMDIANIHAKYHEWGHALSNKLIEAAVQHLVYRIKPELFEGLGYLQYRTHDYYISETHQKQNMIKDK